MIRQESMERLARGASIMLKRWAKDYRGGDEEAYWEAVEFLKLGGFSSAIAQEVFRELVAQEEGE